MLLDIIRFKNIVLYAFEYNQGIEQVYWDY